MTPGILSPKRQSYRGTDGNRTRVHGFADRYLATRSPCLIRALHDALPLALGLGLVRMLESLMLTRLTEETSRAS